MNKVFVCRFFGLMSARFFAALAGPAFAQPFLTAVGAIKP